MHSLVVCIKCNDVFYTKMYKFLKCHCTVKWFPWTSFMLPAFIKHWHNYRNSLWFWAKCRNNSFKVSKMVVRWHTYFFAIHIICATVIKYITYNINIVPSYTFVYNTFAFTTAKSRNSNINFIRISLIAEKCNWFRMLNGLSFAPFNKVLVDFVGKFFTSRHTDNAKRTDRNCVDADCCLSSHSKKMLLSNVHEYSTIKAQYCK